jgi:hypothetical protein
MRDLDPLKCNACNRIAVPNTRPSRDTRSPARLKRPRETQLHNGCLITRALDMLADWIISLNMEIDILVNLGRRIG